MSGYSNQIVDGDGTLIRDRIQSTNYAAGVSGWVINADGTAEFASVTIDGGSLLITYADGSTLRLQAANTGVRMVASALATVFLSAHVFNDVGERFQLLADGRHRWGDGSGAFDAELYRRGINQLGINAGLMVDTSNVNNTPLAAQVAGEAFPRFQVRGDGAILWGGGAAGPDLSISRFGAGRLALGADQALDVNPSVAGNVGNPFLRSTVTGEGNARYFIEYGGKHHWGPGGASSQDTVLYRAGVGQLAADPIFYNNGGAAEAWQGLGPVAGWLNSGSGVNGSYRRVASPPNSVELVGDLTPGTKTDGTTIATLAGGYRPTSLRTIPVSVDVTGAAGGQSPHFTIDSAGLVKCYGCAAAGRVMVEALFSTDL